jgi:hypothetical protein
MSCWSISEKISKTLATLEIWQKIAQLHSLTGLAPNKDLQETALDKVYYYQGKYDGLTEAYRRQCKY